MRWIGRASSWMAAVGAWLAIAVTLVGCPSPMDPHDCPPGRTRYYWSGRLCIEVDACIAAAASLDENENSCVEHHRSCPVLVENVNYNALPRDARRRLDPRARRDWSNAVRAHAMDEWQRLRISFARPLTDEDREALRCLGVLPESFEPGAPVGAWVPTFSLLYLVQYDFVRLVESHLAIATRE